VLGKLRLFQELGHTPIFLIGDFTARIAIRPGGRRLGPRSPPTRSRQMPRTYVAQAGLLPRREARRDPLQQRVVGSIDSRRDWIRLCSRYTVARLLERDDFAKRYAATSRSPVPRAAVSFAQAYDSVALRATSSSAATDQTFNLLMAREIQRDLLARFRRPVLTHPLLRWAPTESRRCRRASGTRSACSIARRHVREES
jgi:tyrosyl-tRNA synthetase